MRCFKTLTLTVFVINALSVGAQEQSLDNLVNPEKAKLMMEQLKKEQFNPQAGKATHDTSWVQQNQQAGNEYAEQARQTMPEFSEVAVNEQIKKHETEAQAMVGNAMAGAQGVLQQQLGLTQQQATGMSGDMTSEATEHFAVFISFSMSDAEIKDALTTAASAGAKVYLKGLKKGHVSITDTMKEMRKLAMKIDNPPETRFNPKAFDQFGVTQVPTIVYQEKGKTYLAKGITNLRWLRGKAIDAKETGDLGVFGPTRPVVEESIINTIQSRLANYDWESQKKKTVASFWGRQNFESLPAASEDKVWYINPTVRVQNDVVNPRGVVLARAGQIINPLDTPMGHQSFVAFDANDKRQVEWAMTYVAKAKKASPVMVMSSQLDKSRGWEHMAELRKGFQSEIYMLPKELIKRFNLTALPVHISPDMSKKVLKVEQFNMSQE